MKAKHARRLDAYQGRAMYVWSVQVTHSNIHGTVVLQEHEVIAPSASDALWQVRQEPEFLTLIKALCEPIEIVTHGVKGGRKSHFLGWESVIGIGVWEYVYDGKRSQQPLFDTPVQLRNHAAIVGLQEAL